MTQTTRLRPPTDEQGLARDLPPDWARALQRGGVEWYRREYNAGWATAARMTDSAKWNSGSYSFAWEDGYLDQAAGRLKWHLAHCPDHDNCGEG